MYERGSNPSLFFVLMVGLIVVISWLFNGNAAAAEPQHPSIDIAPVPVQVERTRLTDLKDWLSWDKTFYHRYIPDVYECENFSHDLIINATRAGFNCSLVVLRMDNMSNNHAVVAFHIEGVTYFVEPQRGVFIDPYSDPDLYVIIVYPDDNPYF